MKEFIDLLIIYWKPIVGLLFTIVGFIIALIKKKPISSIEGDIFDFAYKAVLATEESGVKGSDNKKAFAINKLNNYLLAKYPTLDVDRYSVFISVVIEMFLNTPQKKG